ncbi:MAG: tRNA uridine-5-carboxymethylaminomethyl(34) synthesis enzyme MnmG [Cardiobacteriaceae bacterium]|nr:tRNA uridine-5-carboxymethylaminomethyl(34) synthesis enzyme MnmG [Cardiobacteriaceae bacterium]
MNTKYGVIVIGGGHAGVEAACAAARSGVRTVLLTHNLDTIGQMSCNPAIGGIGKGHLVKEIDALDGIMARAADLAGIQWRILNSRKGAAVRATRCQADRALYKSAVRMMVENQENLDIFQTAVCNLILTDNGSQVCGVKTLHQIDFYADAVVLTAGTFLAGKIHIGLNNFAGGRAADMPSIKLAEALRDLPFDTHRMKTGTPPRLDRRTIDFSLLEEQAGDNPLPVFSYLSDANSHPEQVSCYITRTNEKTHDIIRSYIDQAPMYAGVIKDAFGPRYCPSIEDKVMRFPDKTSHQLFLEPESLTSGEIYPNGVSTSLPFEAQVKYVQSIRGLENARIVRPGYAIEYDFFNPQDLERSLETKKIKNLYFAGQINGTTGYEEAAAQGILAGINAALRVKGKDDWYPERDQAYIAVMTDDLITQGTREPYRMFTSRAEYRLLLREDNADQRLTAIGFALGCVSEKRMRAFEAKMRDISAVSESLSNLKIKADAVENLEQGTTAAELIKRPEFDCLTVMRLAGVSEENLPSNEIAEQVAIEHKYSGYIERQYQEAEKIKNHGKTRLPKPFDYSAVRGLSAELTEKLNRVQPLDIAQASRIPAITPAALSVILIHLKKYGKNL